jgi:hypothetical protein
MTKLMEKKIMNISLKEAPSSIESRNLELARKITPERDQRSIIRTKMIPELDKNIR